MPQAQTAEPNFNEILRQVAREKDIDLERWIAALEDAMASAAKKQHRIKEPVRAQPRPRHRASSTPSSSRRSSRRSRTRSPSGPSTRRATTRPTPQVGDEILLADLDRGAGPHRRAVGQAGPLPAGARGRAREHLQRVHRPRRRGGQRHRQALRARRHHRRPRPHRGHRAAPASRPATSATARASASAPSSSTSTSSPKGPQIVLSRTDPRLLVKLFEMEVPEIYDGTVVIKGCGPRARASAPRSPVYSRERDVDPVGACVGMKGSRVQSIIRELRGEKIDIIEYSRRPGDLRPERPGAGQDHPRLGHPPGRGAAPRRHRRGRAALARHRQARPERPPGLRADRLPASTSRARATSRTRSPTRSPACSRTPSAAPRPRRPTRIDWSQAPEVDEEAVAKLTAAGYATLEDAARRPRSTLWRRSSEVGLDRAEAISAWAREAQRGARAAAGRGAGRRPQAPQEAQPTSSMADDDFIAALLEGLPGERASRASARDAAEATEGEAEDAAAAAAAEAKARRRARRDGPRRLAGRRADGK